MKILKNDSGVKAVKKALGIKTARPKRRSKKATDAIKRKAYKQGLKKGRAQAKRKKRRY